MAVAIATTIFINFAAAIAIAVADGSRVGCEATCCELPNPIGVSNGRFILAVSTAVIVIAAAIAAAAACT